MNIAILGAGQLGKELYETLKEKYLCDLYSHNNFDICNNMQLDEIVKTYDFIINCVANINADKIEYDKREKTISYNVNFLAVKNLAMLCKFYDKKLIHISSDYVYGSNDYNEILNESYECHPINQYGIDKLAGENAIINEQLNSFLILRVAWLFGKYGKNNFIEKIKSKINENNEIKVVDDQIGNITSTKTVIEIIKKYLNNEIPNGIYNVQNNDEIVSRYEIAYFILKYLKSNCKIISCKTNDYKLPAKRQLNSNLDTTKIRKYCYIRSWKTEIENYLNKNN